MKTLKRIGPLFQVLSQNYMLFGDTQEAVAYNSNKHHWSESNLGSSGEFYSRYSGREHLFSIMLYYYVLDTEFQAEHLHCLSLACRRIKYPSL